MGWSNHVLSFPFTKIAANGQGDLQLALHTGSLSQTAMMTGAAGIINMWSMHKGFKDSHIFSDRYGDTNSARLAALQDKNYGMIAPYEMNFATFLSRLKSDNTFKWVYDCPGSGDVLRALDFEYYTDEAVCPMPIVRDIDTPIGIPATTKFYGIPVVPVENDLHGLNLSDLAPYNPFVDMNHLDNYYPGVVLWNNSETHYATADYPVKDKPSYKPHISVPFTGLSETTYNVRCFLSQWQIQQDTPPNPGYFVACDDPVRTYTFYYIGPGPEPYMILTELTVKNLAAPGQPQQLRYIVRIKNQSGNTASISNATLIVGDPAAIIPPIGETISLTGLNGSYANQEQKGAADYILDEHNIGDPVTFYAEVSGVSGQATLEGTGAVE